MKNINQANLRYLVYLSSISILLSSCIGGGGGGGGQSSASTSSTPASFALAQCQQPNLGVNLDGVSYYSASKPYVDLVKMADSWRRPFSSTATTPIKVDQNGYPVDTSPDTQAVSIISDFKWTTTIPSAPYVLTWDGSGTIQVGGMSTTISTSPNRVVFTVYGDSGGSRFWLTTSPNGGSTPVSNVHIVPLADEGTSQLFDPTFIQQAGRFKTLRFMDWGQTNTNTIQNWADRPTPSSYTQAGAYGTSYEDMLALANQLNDNLWVNVPAEASDDYMQQMAHLFHVNMHAGQTVYVEYSNEVWNTFQQGVYVQQMGEAAGYAKPATGGYDGGSGYTARLDYYSAQVAKLSRIWHQEFGDKTTSGGPKVVVVMAGQAASPGVLGEELQFNNNGATVDAATVAFYFLDSSVINSQNAASWRNSTPAQLIAAGTNSLPTIETPIQDNLKLVQSYHLPLLFYEGGQSLAPSPDFQPEPDGTLMSNDTPVLDLMFNTNSYSGMGTLYTTALNDWSQKLGGGLFLLFNLNGGYTITSKYGYWGLRNGQAASVIDSPKLQAVYQYCGLPIGN